MVQEGECGVTDFSLFLSYINERNLTPSQVNALINKLQDHGLISDNIERPENVANADWMKITTQHRELL